MVNLIRWKYYFELKHKLMVLRNGGLCCHLWRNLLHRLQVVELLLFWLLSWWLYRHYPIFDKLFTVDLVTTLTFLLCDPFPPVLGSPTLFLRFSMFLLIYSSETCIVHKKIQLIQCSARSIARRWTQVDWRGGAGDLDENFCC